VSDTAGEETMPSKEKITDELKRKIEQLFRDNPKSKPSEIIKILKGLEKKLPFISPQIVAAIKRKMPAGEVEDSLKTKAPVKKEMEGGKVRYFKNIKTGKKFEVKPGESMRHFFLPGDTIAYSLDDFIEMVKKNCGVIKELDFNSSITEIPMETLTVEDIFLGGRVG
jgi:hypothetical protein